MREASNNSDIGRLSLSLTDQDPEWLSHCGYETVLAGQVDFFSTLSWSHIAIYSGHKKSAFYGGGGVKVTGFLI